MVDEPLRHVLTRILDNYESISIRVNEGKGWESKFLPECYDSTVARWIIDYIFKDYLGD